MSIKSMISFAIRTSACICIMMLLSSCCTFCNNEPSKFPLRATPVEYTTDPVKSYNATDKTYVISAAYMENSLADHIFVREIMKWKVDNNIK